MIKNISIGLLLFMAIMIVLWTFGWISVPFQVTSPENVKKQWAFAYQFEESLNATALQYCSAKNAIADASSENEKMQRRSQLLAIEQNYARIQAEYNAKLRNAFEAKLVKPSDVPTVAPALGEKAQACK